MILNLQYDNTRDDESGGDKMDNDGLAIEFFAAELRPNEGEQNTHEENHDRSGGVGGGRSEGYRRSEGERGAIRKIFRNAEKARAEERTKDFLAAGF